MRTWLCILALGTAVAASSIGCSAKRPGVTVIEPGYTYAKDPVALQRIHQPRTASTAAVLEADFNDSILPAVPLD